MNRTHIATVLPTDVGLDLYYLRHSKRSWRRHEGDRFERLNLPSTVLHFRLLLAMARVSKKLIARQKSQGRVGCAAQQEVGKLVEKA